MTDRYPVLLRLDGERCLVVGGGPVGERKVRGLLTVGAHVTVLAPTVVDALRDLADAGSITWDRRRYAPGDAAGSWRFVVAATDDRATNRQVADDARAAGVWANDASAPDGGPASTPAVARRGPITVAVATGGAHPGAAAALRDLAVAAIGPEHVVAVELLDEVHRDAEAAGLAVTRPDWRQAVDSGMLELIRAGQRAEAKERLQACLSSSSD